MKEISYKSKKFFQFFKFSIIGGLGFGIDVATFYFFNLALNTYLSRLGSFVVAVIFTYIFNKLFTFDVIYSRINFWKEFPAYFGSMVIGGAVNLITFFLLETYSSFFSHRHYLAIAMGSASGLVINFFLSVFIFQERTKKE